MSDDRSWLFPASLYSLVHFVDMAAAHKRFMLMIVLTTYKLSNLLL